MIKFGKSRERYKRLRLFPMALAALMVRAWKQDGFKQLFIFSLLISSITGFYIGFLNGLEYFLWTDTGISKQAGLVLATFSTLATAHLALPVDRARNDIIFAAPLTKGWLTGMAILGGLACLTATLLIFFLAAMLFGERAATINLDIGIAQRTTFAATAIVIAGTGILIPLAEELLFRRWLFGRLAGIGMVRAFIPASTLIFGFAHVGQSPLKALTIMLLGALCASLYARSRSIVWPWLAHALNNTLAILLGAFLS